MTTYADVEELIKKAPTKGSEAVGPERKAFLDAALLKHLGAELVGDLLAITATYAEEDGHLNFNGVIYKTEEQLTAFHKGFGFSNEGMLSGIGGDITHITYTQESMIVEYALRATIEIDLPDAPAGRPVAIPMCVLYEFDEAGKLTSERVYTDLAAVLPKPLLQL